MAASQKVEEGTLESKRQETVLQLVAFQIMMFCFGVGLVTILIVILTTSGEQDSPAMKRNLGIYLLVVVPACYLYFVYKNVMNISMIFHSSQLPEAKESSTVLAIFYYVFVVITFL